MRVAMLVRPFDLPLRVSRIAYHSYGNSASRPYPPHPSIQIGENDSLHFDQVKTVAKHYSDRAVGH